MLLGDLTGNDAVVALESTLSSFLRSKEIHTVLRLFHLLGEVLAKNRVHQRINIVARFISDAIGSRHPSRDADHLTGLWFYCQKQYREAIRYLEDASVYDLATITLGQDRPGYFSTSATDLLHQTYQHIGSESVWRQIRGRELTPGYVLPYSDRVCEAVKSIHLGPGRHVWRGADPSPEFDRALRYIRCRVASFFQHIFNPDQLAGIYISLADHNLRTSDFHECASSLQSAIRILGQPGPVSSCQGCIEGIHQLKTHMERLLREAAFVREFAPRLVLQRAMHTVHGGEYHLKICPTSGFSGVTGMEGTIERMVSEQSLHRGIEPLTKKLLSTFKRFWIWSLLSAGVVSRI